MAAWHGSCCSTISWSSLKIKNFHGRGILRLYCHPGWFNHLREMLFAEQWQTPASSHRPKERFSLAQGQLLFLNEVWQQRVEIPEVCPSPTQPAVQAQLPNVHLVEIFWFAHESLNFCIGWRHLNSFTWTQPLWLLQGQGGGKFCKAFCWQFPIQAFKPKYRLLFVGKQWNWASLQFCWVVCSHQNWNFNSLAVLAGRSHTSSEARLLRQRCV